MGYEIFDEMTKSAEYKKVAKMIYYEFFERVGHRKRLRWNALATCKATKIMSNGSKGYNYFFLVCNASRMNISRYRMVKVNASSVSVCLRLKLVSDISKLCSSRS